MTRTAPNLRPFDIPQQLKTLLVVMRPRSPTPVSCRDMVRRMMAELFGVPEPPPVPTELPEGAAPFPPVRPSPSDRLPPPPPGSIWPLYRPDALEESTIVPLPYRVGTETGPHFVPVADTSPGPTAAPDAQLPAASIFQPATVHDAVREDFAPHEPPTAVDDSSASPAATTFAPGETPPASPPLRDADPFVLDLEPAESALFPPPVSAPAVTASDMDTGPASTAPSDRASSSRHIENLIESLDRQLTTAGESQARMLNRLSDLLRRALASHGDVARIVERVEALETAHHLRGRL